MVPGRSFDERGGVWILTGVFLGLLVYAGVVLMAVAGFTAVEPLVLLPPVVLGLIAANSLLGGGRGHGRSPAVPSGDRPLPSSSVPNGPHPDGAAPPVERRPPPEEPAGPA